VSARHPFATSAAAAASVSVRDGLEHCPGQAFNLHMQSPQRTHCDIKAQHRAFFNQQLHDETDK
jgi:hypothetical protein